MLSTREIGHISEFPSAHIARHPTATATAIATVAWVLQRRYGRPPPPTTGWAYQ